MYILCPLFLERNAPIKKRLRISHHHIETVEQLRLQRGCTYYTYDMIWYDSIPVFRRKMLGHGRSYPGFRVTLISRYFFAQQSTPPLFWHAAFGPSANSRLRRERVYQLGVSSTAACGSLQIGHPSFLNGGLHLSTSGCCSARNWSKFGTHKMRPQQKKKWTFAFHLRTTTGLHKQSQPAKLGHTPDGMCESVGRTSLQS